MHRIEGLLIRPNQKGGCSFSGLAFLADYDSSLHVLSNCSTEKG